MRNENDQRFGQWVVNNRLSRGDHIELFNKESVRSSIHILITGYDLSLGIIKGYMLSWATEPVQGSKV